VLRRRAGQHSLIAALTPSQNGAVLKALQQRLSLVQGQVLSCLRLEAKKFHRLAGPPGTGKTHVACVSWHSVLVHAGTWWYTLAGSVCGE
jgi:DNA replication protein DnaC